MQSDLHNSPDLWRRFLPVFPREVHKYLKGQANILAGEARYSGAAMLASEAALRIGAGLSTLLVPEQDMAIYAAACRHAVIKRPMEEMTQLLGDARPQAWLAGPGLGVSDHSRLKVREILQAKKPTVLDADALTAFADSPEVLFAALHGECLLTPHEGEFAALFPGYKGNKAERALQAAKRSGAVVLIKGADTFIATPQGQVIHHSADAPQLATAGAGDVLAGICVGLLAQGMELPMAAAAAVWIHARVAQIIGRGLIADDLAAALPGVLQGLYAVSNQQTHPCIPVLGN